MAEAMKRSVRMALIVLPALLASCSEKPKGPPPPPPSRFTEVTHLDAAVVEVKGYSLRDGMAFAKKSSAIDADDNVSVDVMVDGIDVRKGLSDFPNEVTGRRGAVFVIGDHQTRLVPPGFVWQPLRGVGEIAKDHWIGYEPRERWLGNGEYAVTLRGKGVQPEPPVSFAVRDVALNGDGAMCAVLREYVDNRESDPPSWSAWFVAKDGKEQVVELADKLEEPPRATRAVGGECVIVSTDILESQRHLVIRHFTEQGLVRLHDLPIPERAPYALSKDGHLWYLGPELHHVALTLKTPKPIDEMWTLPPAVPGCVSPHPRAIFPSRGEDVWLALECGAPKHLSLLHAPPQGAAWK